jgi:hypothetical protein
MNPLAVIFDLINGVGNISQAFSLLLFTELPILLDVSVFGLLFSPATFLIIFGLVLAKKLTPLL